MADRWGDRDRDRERDRERDRGRDYGRERDRGRERDIRDDRRDVGDRRDSNVDRRDWRDDRRLMGPPVDRRESGPVGRDRREPAPFDRRDSAQARRPSAALLKPMEKIDREKTCPLLLRLFCKIGSNHTPEDFQNGKVPKDDEVIMHTWLDATLKELTVLIREVMDEARPRGTRMVFSVVYPTQKGAIVLKELGSTKTGTKGECDDIALGQTRFKVGDYIDVAVYPPQSSGIFGATHMRGRGESMRESSERKERDERKREREAADVAYTAL